jgi:2',3'-cyclic-nucleotide 2'-phosphodiesterase (5'-nucleotidase family)
MPVQYSICTAQRRGIVHMNSTARFVPNTTGASKSGLCALAINLKRHLFVLAALVVTTLCSPAFSFAATIAGWDVSTMPGGSNNFGPQSVFPAVWNSNLSYGGLVRGSGVGTTGTGAARGWGGNTWISSSKDAAITANQYAAFSFVVHPGYNLSLSAISRFDYRRSATGPTTGVVQYQVGSGSFTDITTVNYSSTSSSGASLSAIGLSGIAALQNIPAGTAVAFRIVNYGGTSSSGTWYIFDVANSTANDFEIQGTVSQAGPTPSNVRVETTADGSGLLVPAQSLTIGNSTTVYAVSRDVNGLFVANVPATWSLVSIVGGVVSTDLIAAGDGKSAVFTPHAGGSAIIDASVTGLSSIDSGVITAEAPSSSPLAMGVASPPTITNDQPELLTVTVTPGANPTSTGLIVTGDLTVLGGAASAMFHDDGMDGDATAGDNVFSFRTTVPSSLAGGPKTVPVLVSDSQGRTASATIGIYVLGSFTIFHVNDTHARVTPHKWIIPGHELMSSDFEYVGGAAYLATKMLQLTSAQPNSLVIDAGDISEGNPIGDMNGNGAMAQFYELLSAKLLAQRGRGMDAVVVGNHDVRDANYVNNLKALKDAGVPVISVNVRDISTHSPYFAPYAIVTINGVRIGILGYTTQAAEVGASLSTTLEVANCDWNSTDSTKIHLATYVNELRNTQGCDIVILAAHVGHSAIATDTTRDSATVAALLADDGAAKLPEVAVTGHWHTFTDTVWQPEMLNYKTIFTESSSYMKYIGELQVNGQGRYIASRQNIIRDSELSPDPDVQGLIDSLTAQYDAAHPDMPVNTVLGYTADPLMLDNTMRWWSADEYPWSGNNTAGQWICDAMQWKAAQLFDGGCDLAIESGGGVRADIPAGPVTYLQVYETFPWNDDTFNRVNMTGQEIINFLKATNCDAGFSRDLDVTAADGVPTNVKFAGQPIDLNHVYTVAINNYMYAHPPTNWTWSDKNPLTSPVLCRDGIVDFMQQFTESNKYTVGGERYHLNTEFSGGYRAVVMMLDDNDTKPAFEAAFIRLLSATTETLARRGSHQVPAELVNEDGTISPNNRLSEQELYRSYLGFKTGALHPGDIIETWGKGSYYGGNPEFVDQEGIYSDGHEFKIVGHDESLAKPMFMRSISEFWRDSYKNHYVKFLARRAGTETVSDQYGWTIRLMDVTAYASKTGIPGNVGDLLLVTGIPTMESYGLRFRGAGVDLASNQGISDFPPTPSVVSEVASIPAMTTNGQVNLVANASPNNPTRIVTPVADSQIASGHATSNYGTSTNLYVQSSASGYGNERDWLKFDLSGLPSDTTISSASLSLYCWRTAGVALATEVRGGNDDSWTETGITWNTQPNFGDALATQTLAAGNINTWYSWDLTNFVQSKWASNKLVSVMVKPVTEGSTDTTAPSYAFDSKEYSSNWPALQVSTQSVGATVADVKFYYRFSGDNATWSNWTLADSLSVAPYASTFAFSQGYGYYEFGSAATDSNGTGEVTPVGASAFVHYVATPDYSTDAVVTLAGLSQVFDGSPKPATATTLPPALARTVTYDSGADVPVHPGSYAVLATVTQPGFSGSATGTLTIARATQSIQWTALAPVNLGVAPFALTASNNSGLPIAYTSSNPSVATVTGALVTVVGLGTTSITATQNGTGDYLAATPVSMDLVVSGPATAAPAMPIWALVAMAGLMLLVAVRTLSHRRTTLP